MRYKEYIRSLPAYKPPTLLAGSQTDLVKLSSNENPLGPSPRAIAALQQHIAAVHRYPDSGAAALRRALADHADLQPEQVLCANGSDELVFLICAAFLREGDAALMAEGTFISYYLRTTEMGGQARRIPLHHYTHDLPAMADAIDRDTRIVFVCNPNNPTGTTVGAAELEPFLARIPDDVLVVLDEAYIEYAIRPDFPDVLPQIRAGRDNLIVLRTFAKIHGLAGLRLGYAFGHNDLISYLDQARPTFNVNLLAQAAGVAALEDHEHVQRSREHAGASRAFFVEALHRLGLEPIAGETNFIAIPVPDDLQASAALRTRGFTVTPLSGWGVPNVIRVSFGTEEQNQRFIKAFAEILA